MELHFSDECGGISIHALLAESDLGPLLRCGRYWHISIHALLAESDADCISRRHLAMKFLSTLSLRRATLRGKAPNKARYNFYPRSPCGERLGEGE